MLGTPATTKDEKSNEIEKPTITLDGRICYSSKKLRAIGNGVYMDLTEFDCPEDVQQFVNAYTRSADANRVKSSASRPLAMAWNEKSMRIMNKEQNKAEKVADRAALAREARGAPDQAKDHKQQKEGRTQVWSSEKVDTNKESLKSKAEWQRRQFEAERAQILKERRRP